MSKNDKTWGQLNKVPVTFNGKALPQKTKTQPIVYLNKQRPAKRVLKALRVYLTSVCSWQVAWHKAAQ